MIDIAERPKHAVSLAALFTAFLIVSLCGFGGGIVWARRITVERRRWITDGDFADIVSLCQFMPGPNIVGIAVCIGARMRGVLGTIAAISGFLIIPWAAGLLIATGIRLLMPHRRRPAALLFAALAFGLITFAGLPLLAVLFSLVPLSIALASIENARAR